MSRRIPLMRKFQARYGFLLKFQVSQYLSRAGVVVLFSAMMLTQSVKAAQDSCMLSADLNGDTQTFWRRGQDAWTGSGRVACGREVREIDIHFTSWESPNGVHADDKLRIQIADIPRSQLKKILGTFRAFRKTDRDSLDPNLFYATALDTRSQVVVWTLSLKHMTTQSFKVNQGLLNMTPLE